MNKQNHHAAIFDLDGTLLDTLDDLANAALHSAGYPQHPVAAYRQFVGNGLRMLVRRALPEGEADRIGPAGFEALVERTGANYARDWAVKTRPYPHIPELLQELVGCPKARHPLGRRDEQAARMDAPHAQALLSRESFPVHSGGYAEPAP